MTWIAFKAHRNGVVYLVLFLAAFGILEVTSFARMSPTAADRAQFGLMMDNVGRATSYILPYPQAVGTLAGYVQWFLIDFIPAFFSAWAVIAGTGAGRGDEEGGLVEQWLGWGLGRTRFVFARFGGFALALLVAILGLDCVLLAADWIAGRSLDAVRLVEQSVAQAASVLPVFAAAMIASQLFITRRGAAGALAFVVGGLYLLNGFSRSIAWLQTWRWITPYAYADRSDAMVSAGHFDVGATLVLVAAAIALTAVAALLMSRRDVGSAILPSRRSGDVRHDFGGTGFATQPVVWRVWDQRIGLAVWAAAVGLYAISNVPLAHPFIDAMLKSTAANREAGIVALGLGGPNPAVGYVSSVWFRVACLLVAIYAVTQAVRWASEDSDGRLEWLLSLGLSRPKVLLERVAALLVGLLVITAGDFVGVLLGSWSANLHIEAGSVALGALMTIPLGLAFGAAGAAIASWRPRVAVVALAGILGMSYMIPFAAVPLFKTPPSWFLNLSAFHMYGSPMVDGIDATGTAELILITAAGIVIALVALQRRDVGA